MQSFAVCFSILNIISVPFVHHYYCIAIYIIEFVLIYLSLALKFLHNNNKTMLRFTFDYIKVVHIDIEPNVFTCKYNTALLLFCRTKEVTIKTDKNNFIAFRIAFKFYTVIVAKIILMQAFQA